MEKTTKRVSPQPEELLENLKEGAKSKEKVSKKEKNNKFVVSSSKTKTQPKKSSNKKTHKSKASTSKSEEKENKSTTGRKWNEKSENLIKGKITPEEGKKIAEALCEYAFEKQLWTEELLNLITEKQTKKENKVWTKIAECLPGRSVQSIHNYCHRTFHPYNYKGFWTKKEEEDLLTLVKEHGKKWELIGKELQRTATNVKDKYKQLGGDHHSTVSLDSTLGSKLKLLKEIEAYVNEKEEDKKYKIFNYPYVFNPTIDEKFNVLFRYDESKEIFKIDSSIKDERSKCIIRNIFKHLINLSAISKIIENKLEISWTVISNNIKTLSFDDCKNEWAKIIKDFGLDEMITKKRDYKMIKQ